MDIQTYEKRIEALETEKLLLQEKLENRNRNHRPFGEMFELTLKFLSNPCKVWERGNLEHKRLVLKLTFQDRLVYQRNQGFRTPEMSSIFKLLRGNCDANFKMAVYGDEKMTDSLF